MSQGLHLSMLKNHAVRAMETILAPEDPTWFSCVQILYLPEELSDLDLLGGKNWELPWFFALE